MPTPPYSCNDLLHLLAILRGENGCPWDRAQTHQSIRYNFVEEVYETLEAIDADNKEMLKEELGDVLLQVAFHATIEQEAEGFSFDDVADGICKKLISRHPHVFGAENAPTAADALRHWETAKQVEKSQRRVSDTLRAVPSCFPALMRAQKMASRAAKARIGPANVQEALLAGKTHVTALEAAIGEGDADMARQALGKLLFSYSNIARFLNLESEDCLHKAADDFLRQVEKSEEKSVASGSEGPVLVQKKSFVINAENESGGM